MKRASGVLLHISSLPGEYSSGDFGKGAYDFVDFLAGSGFSYWQTLPFCLPDDTASAYQSFSAFSCNPYFIDIDQLYVEGLITEEEKNQAKQKTPYKMEFERLVKERLPLLAKAAERVKDFSAVESFINENPYLHRFCSFMAYREANENKPWRLWSKEHFSFPTYQTWAFISYTFFKQWQRLKAYANQKGISLIGDIPIYVAYESADVFSEPQLFLLDEDNLPLAVAGVPPDYFSEDGQLWGNPIYRWEKMKEEGFAFWRARVEQIFSLFDGVRLDHFRGFDTYYQVPYGAPNAREGTWQQGPREALVDVLKESAAGKLVIAEDLGENTPSVQSLLDYSGFLGMRVLQFGFLGGEETRHLPHNYEKSCVAYTGTHDNNTFLGYLMESAEETRQRALDYCGYEKKEGWDKDNTFLLRTMLASAADLVIFPMQDLLYFGADTRMNTPGTAKENWLYRMTAEQLKSIDRKRLAFLNSLYYRS
ncbi:MAG: 4-alpha-glucanotransferase [Clostridia bacterium]|nr:4-alpha-glucanotransferase [Clostridia bacterium]